MKILKNNYVNWDEISSLQKVAICLAFNQTDKNSLKEKDTIENTIKLLNSKPTLIDKEIYKDICDYVKNNENNSYNVELFAPRIHQAIHRELLETDKYTVKVIKNDIETESCTSNNYKQAKEKAINIFNSNECDEVNIINNFNFEKGKEVLFYKNINTEIDFNNINTYSGVVDEQIFTEFYNTNKPVAASMIYDDVSRNIINELELHNIELKIDKGNLVAEKNDIKYQTSIEDILDISHNSVLNRTIKPLPGTNISELIELRKNINDYIDDFKTCKKLESTRLKKDIINDENLFIKKNNKIETTVEEDILNAIEKYHCTGNNLMNVLYNDDKNLYESIEKKCNAKNINTADIPQYTQQIYRDNQNEKLTLLKNEYEKNVEKALAADPKTYKNILNKKLKEKLTDKQIDNVETNAENMAKEFNEQKNNKINTDNKTKNKGMKRI